MTKTGPVDGSKVWNGARWLTPAERVAELDMGAASFVGEREMLSGLVSDAQLDGRACLECGREDGTMAPVGTFNGVQLFVHEGCRK